MSFFIRKKSKNLNLTKTAGGGDGNRLKNKDYKPRPTNRKKALGGKRKKGSFVQEPEKRARFDKDEEIESSSSEDDEVLEDNLHHKGKRSDDDEDFSQDENYDDTGETAQEKKLRLAKLYLEEIQKQEKRRKQHNDEDGGGDDDDDDDTSAIASKLKEDVLEAEGRLRREVADQIEPDLENICVLTCSKYLKRSVTCLCITEDDRYIFSGSKDGHIFKWDVLEKRKVGLIKRKEVLSKKQKKKNKANNKSKSEPDTDQNATHTSAISALAVTSDGKFLASGDHDGKIVIWGVDDLKRIHVFTGHRGGIRGLTFRKKKHTLYSCSDDRSVRIWDLDAMGYVESLFGHQDAVTCIDSLTRERVVTGGGRDGTVRVWKIVEESQLVYNGHPNGNIDCVKLINEENFVSAGDDGTISTWNVNRKKPLHVTTKAHGTYKSFPGCEIDTPRWVSALTAWTNTDLVASGSCDGAVRFWRAGERFKSLVGGVTVDVEGWVNTMEFSSGTETTEAGMEKRGKFLVVGTGKENRLGRWFPDCKEGKNSVVIIPLRYKKKGESDQKCVVGVDLDLDLGLPDVGTIVQNGVKDEDDMSERSASVLGDQPHDFFTIFDK